MDVEEVLAVFQEENGGPAPSPLVPSTPPVDGAAPAVSAPNVRRRMNDENSSGMRTAAVVVIVVLIGLIIGVRELIEKYQREKVTVASEPATSNVNAEAPASTTNSNAAAAPTPPPAVATSPTPPPPAPAPEPVKPTPPPPPEKKAEVKPEPKQEPKPEAKPEPKKEEVAAEPAPASAPEPEKKLTKAVKNEIILEALDNVEVKMQIKGETKRLSLGPTQVHTIRSSSPVSFDFSDGGAVSITVNGRERGPAGELGKPKQITIP